MILLARSAGLSKIHPHRWASAERNTTCTRASVPADCQRLPLGSATGTQTHIRLIDRERAELTHPYRAEMDLEVPVDHGAGLADRRRRHEPDATANHASHSSGTVEDDATCRCARTSAIKFSRPRSASARLPTTVAVRYRRIPVSASVPA